MRRYGVERKDTVDVLNCTLLSVCVREIQTTAYSDKWFVDITVDLMFAPDRCLLSFIGPQEVFRLDLQVSVDCHFNIILPYQACTKPAGLMITSLLCSSSCKSLQIVHYCMVACLQSVLMGLTSFTLVPSLCLLSHHASDTFFLRA